MLGRLDIGGKSQQFHDHQGQRDLWIGLINLLLENASEIDMPAGLDAATLADEIGLASSV